MKKNTKKYINILIVITLKRITFLLREYATNIIIENWN